MDVGRFRWSSLNIDFAVLGIILFVLGGIIFNWAVMVNPHFEPTVRIQKDRDHQVVTNGPYRIVRHPGYLAGILFPISTTFVVGSVYGLVPAAFSFFLIVVRTWLEDRTLQRELTGYSEYAMRVRYRLVPAVW